MPDILAIVSKAVFERDARLDDDEPIAIGDVWPVDRYNSSAKALQSLGDGGRIFLVTVRPPNEQLWFVGLVDKPAFDGTAWVSPRPNTLPVTNITPLRKTIVFESGKGISQDKGTLGMSLQTPRSLAAADVAQILAAVTEGGVAEGAVGKLATMPSAAPLKPSKPRIIGGKYEIIRELGKGGMGVVYEARHTGTSRRVAVKEIISAELGSDSKLVERFYREARATGAIETQHVTPVLDTGSDPDTSNPFLVMELLVGTDLQARLDDGGPLTEPVALRVIAQACTGLARAHAAGVIHRDIKPANLFLARRDDDVVVKLLDFGVARVKEELAKSTSEGIHRALTSTGVMLGTPLYMSPEQVMGEKTLDHRSDLWSLAIVLYETLAGITPYDEIETMGALLVSICSKPPRSIREHAPHVSEKTEAILTRALQLDPAKRYATADEMLADLKRGLPDLRLDATSLAAP